VQDFRISNIFEQAKLIRLFMQLFPDLNLPQSTTVAEPQNAPNYDETSLPPYEEQTF
jgi:hypothetical protein